MATPTVDSVASCFLSVTIRGDAIDTNQFLAAVDEFLLFLDVLAIHDLDGSREDMANNVKVIREQVAAAPAQSQTLQDMVGACGAPYSAVESLLWLFRALEFACRAIQYTIHRREELKHAFADAFKDTLYRHHRFVTKRILKKAVESSCPPREVLISKMGSDTDRVYQGLQQWVTGAERILRVLGPFLATKEPMF